MAITFYQAILAFCLQDGPEALTQVSSVNIRTLVQLRDSDNFHYSLSELYQLAFAWNDHVGH